MQNYKNVSIMQWTKPDTDKQVKLYSKFSGVMANYSRARVFTQYVLWLPIASFALTKIVIDGIDRFFHIPFFIAFVPLFLFVFFIHKLLFSEFETYCFDKLDGNKETNSSIWFSLILCSGLVALEYIAASQTLISTLENPVAEKYTEPDSLYNAKILELNNLYLTRKDNAEENYKEQIISASPTLYNDWQDWEAKKPNDYKDKLYIEKMRKKYRTRFYQNSKVAEVLATKQTYLNDLQKNHESELTKLQNERDLTKTKIDSDNAAAVAGFNSDVLAAKGIGGILSLVCLLIFIWCTYKEVQLKCLCGIFPVRSFTDLKAHGSTSSKAFAVISDVITRWIHARLLNFHRTYSSKIGQLTSLDGTLIMEDGNYQKHEKTEDLNGKKVLDSLKK